jgi:hypothetical protein
VKVENPVAFSFIMQDDLYLRDEDRVQPGGRAAPAPFAEIKPVQFKYMGGYTTKFLVVVYYPDLEFIAGNHLEALSNILKRLAFNIEDIAILNLANYDEVTFSDLLDFFKPQKLLLLGEGALPIGMETLTINVPKQINSCNALFSYNFNEMMDNVEYKKAFWEKMKQL